MKDLINLLDTPEHKEMAAIVVAQIRSRVKQKNYFAWRTYIDDVIIDAISYMISTNYSYSIGGYIQTGMTTAIDKCRYCNAKCRKGNYESVSIDDEDTYLQLEDTASNVEQNYIAKAHQTDIYNKILNQYGKQLADQLKPIIYDEDTKLEKSILKKVKTQEFKEFLLTL